MRGTLLGGEGAWTRPGSPDRPPFGAPPDPPDEPARVTTWVGWRVVRVLAVADEVEERLWAEDARRFRPDLVVGCGDVQLDLLGWLAGTSDVPLVFVPGNHDPDLTGVRHSRSGLVLRAGMPVEAPWPPGTINVDGRVVDVAGVRVAGLGGSRRYGEGANQYTERQQARRVRGLVARARRQRPRRRPVDIVLTHAPPAGVGDGDDPVHEGFAAFHDLISSLQPRLFLHGHVNPVGGLVERHVGATRVINVFDHQLVDLDCAAIPIGGTAPPRTG